MGVFTRISGGSWQMKNIGSTPFPLLFSTDIHTRAAPRHMPSSFTR